MVPDPAVRVTLVTGDLWSRTEDVNARGTVVGGVGAGEGSSTQAYSWRRGRLRLLDPPDAGDFSHATAVNRRGDVLVLPAPEGSRAWDLRDVNNLGQMVGFTSFPDGTYRLTVWTAGRPMLLPDNPGVSPVGDKTMINDLGQVAWTERSDEDSSPPVTFVWWFGRLVPLGEGILVDIDDGGDIVGYVQPGGGANPTHALHWSVDWRAVFHRPN